jgi:hypothetical protein
VESQPLDLDLEHWEPWTPPEVAARLDGVNARWYVLGGWALDLFVGRQTREHTDLEIGVRQEDFSEIRTALAQFELLVVGDGRAWPLNEESAKAYRQTWVREPGGPWRLDVIRERWSADSWVYRRVRCPSSGAIAVTSDGIPFLRPELVLLFKAKDTRPKDTADLEVMLPVLESDRRRWLHDAIAVAHPGHEWLDALRA